MSPPTEDGALDEHAYWCFEVISAKLNGGTPLVPDFDQSLE